MKKTDKFIRISTVNGAELLVGVHIARHVLRFNQNSLSLRVKLYFFKLSAAG